jgi:plasmid stability protein
MSVAITIRNVPEEVRNKLAARAAGSGRSLQEYLLAELTAAATALTIEDIVAHIRPVTATSVIAVNDVLDAVHADRR